MARILIVAVLVLGLAGLGLWFLGPREPVDATISFDAASLGDDPTSYLERIEADVPNLRPADAKEIVWAYPASRARTPLSIVYIHGFSASKAEVRPLADKVAAALGANLFYTRLSGHGRDGAAMGEASVNDWVNDLAEATAIGRALGNRVIVIGNSTGGTLATYGATLPGVMEDVGGLVLLSPNFRLLDRWAFLLDLPFARDLLPLIGGETRSFTPRSPEQAEHWTTSYPTTALLPMAALLRAVARIDVGRIDLPLLALFSPADQVVDAAATEALVAAWGGPHAAVEVPVTGDPANHVIAGDILSPQTTDALAARIVAWIEALPAR
ncbi:lysophospholipase [Aurantimonas sp. Leaf443]|nr:alpha/beta fold hydrolase [Aurantimonas sp. Leaf443]KQT88595.1 lysophospholipase [Aurantimonas sp. Leaf443]